MAFKKRFRNTRKATHKKRKNKTMRKKGGSNAEDLFEILDKKVYTGLAINPKDDPKQRDEKQKKRELILDSIQAFIKEKKDVEIADNASIGQKGKNTLNKMSSGVDSTIETIGSWLFPAEDPNKEKKKNTSEITLYFYPSLIKSKKDENKPNNPKLRFGRIMIKHNNKYADISNYIKTMFRQTDDTLAVMRQGFTHSVQPAFFHKEKVTSTELLEDAK